MSDELAPVMCPHCRDVFDHDDQADGDIIFQGPDRVVCTMCFKAGRPPAPQPER